MTLRPSPEDIALAPAWIDGEYRLTVCPIWFGHHRDEAIRHAATAEMQKRERAEFVNSAERFRALAAQQRKDAA